MAKKFVRGITDIKTISKQDFDTNNVNDLLSDGQYSYIHRKKGKTEEYHNLTDNLKTLSSDNTDLLTVTNNNKTNNTATLSPKHDVQKEQLIESTRNTITINHGSNGTPETTKVDTNPQKVLEHDNLTGNTNYVKIEHTSGNNTTLINSNQISQKFATVDNALLTKQDKLMAGAGIELKNNIISVLHVSQSTVNCNNIITTQYLKVGIGSTNLPKDIQPYGILSVVRIADVVEQTYQDYKNYGRFVRTCYQVDTSPKWSPWLKIVTQPVS